MDKVRTTRQKIIYAFVYLLLILMAFTFLYPLFFSFVNSLKTQPEYMKSSFSINILHGHFENYALIFSNFHIERFLGNTLLVTLLKLGIMMPIAICASYAFAKLRFRGKNVAYPMILVVMFIPFQVIMIPVYVLMSRMHLIDTYIGLALVSGTLCLPGMIFLLASNFRAIPTSMIEAATIDGCGYFGIIKNIIVPMGKPAISICLIMNFVTSWNDLLAPMVIMKSPGKQLVIPALNNLVSLFAKDIPFQLTGLMVASLPAILIYIVMQRQIIMGISTGSTK